MKLRTLLLGLLMMSMFMTAPVHAATLSPGDLIKASGPSVYYYAQDGKRYVFPTEKTYFTWYSDFSSVKTVTDSELAALMIGGNVTYRPTVKLVKITTDPKVYAVGPYKQLRWIKTEALATELYSSAWATVVEDIPDTFFINYMLGTDISVAADFDRSSILSGANNIQSTFVIATPTPSPAPIPAATSTGGLQLSVSKATVRAGDTETLTAVATSTSGISKIDLFFDGVLIQSCNSSSCVGDVIIPISGTKSLYTAEAKAYAVDSTIKTQTVLVALDNSSSGLASITIDRAIIRQNQSAGITVDADVSIAILRTDIYKDNVSIRACASSIRQCRWSEQLTGAVGTVYDYYGKVTDTLGRTYLTPHKTVTIGSNDSPIVTVGIGKASIYKGETVDVTVSASDDDGITQIEVLKDFSVIKTCQSGAPCTIITGPWQEAGTLVFSGRATDALGQSATSSNAIITVN
ncbi:MAG: hypothetical protein AAB386_00020 [Patescibacteria group bacterium]